MKTIENAIRAFLEKRPLLADVLKTTLKAFVFAVCAVIAGYLLLLCTGIYPVLQTALDLKFNAPVLLTLIFVFGALGVICWTAGALVYFRKYKRPKTKTAFYEKLLPVFGKK